MGRGLQKDLQRLKEEDPVTFAVLEKHIDVVKIGVERCPVNFPTAEKLLKYADAEEDFYTQHVGRCLSVLNALGAVDIYRKESNPVRYDLTDYDDERLQEVYELLR